MASTSSSVLSTALNSLVYRGWPRHLAVVKAVRWRHVVDERISVASNGIAPAEQQATVVVITQLEACPMPTDPPDAQPPALPYCHNDIINYSDDDELPFHAESSRGGADAVQRQTQEVPLLGTRRHCGWIRRGAAHWRWTQSVDDHDDNDGSGALPADASGYPPLECSGEPRCAPTAAQSSAVRV